MQSRKLFKPRYFEHSTWIMWLNAYGLSEFDSNVEKNQWLENVCPKSKKDCEEYTLHYIIWNWNQDFKNVEEQQTKCMV